MPSESIAGFFNRARASRVLFPEQIEQLIRQPDFPHANLDSLCEYLEERGAITRFQADAIRGGNGDALNFASYPIIDEIGPCPGGIAYRALHPSLRTPIELRRFQAEALFPTDTPAALLQRARSASELHHPFLVTLLDVGQVGEEVYAAIEPPADSGPLDVLVRDIGPMPGFLAAEYGRQAASALRAAHERGLPHGDVRPQNCFVGPMTAKAGPDATIKRRPAPNAAVKLAELGLVPIRPAAVISAPSLIELPYLPPERLENAAHDPRGDLYSLGATLYFLLTGRPPHAGNTAAELIQKVRAAEPASLSTLRPDIPPGYAQLILQMLNKRPDDRPATAYDVEQSLQVFCRPGSIPPPPPASGVPATVALVEDEAAPAAEASTADEWGAGEQFSTAHASAAPRPKRQLTAQDKSRTRMLVILGLCLHICGLALLIAIFSGAFNNWTEPEPDPAPTKKEPLKKTKRPHS
jgi:serine/threonine protein kinase